MAGWDACRNPKLEPHTIDTPFKKPVLRDLPIEKIQKGRGGVKGGDEHVVVQIKVSFSQPPMSLWY